MTSLSFNGFNLTSASSPRGGRFRLLELDGWLSVGQSRNRESKSQQAGAYDSTGYVAALPITARGEAFYSPAASAQAALERRELVALAGGGRYEMTVVDASGLRSRVVECDSFTVTPRTQWMYEWAFSATAVDPLLYGPVAFSQTGLSSAAGGTGLTFPLSFPLSFGVAGGVTPGVVPVANAGTSSYFPRLRIDGPVTNPVVTLAETGDRVKFTGTVAAGQWLDVDCARRRVLLNGVVSMRHKVSFTGAWLAVPVGGGTVSWTADTADPAASLSVWSYEGAWL